MSKELRKYLLEKNLKSFDVLAKNVGNKIVVHFNKSMQDNLPPVAAKISGVLEEIVNFSHVRVSGKVIDFVSKRHIISRILGKEGELYDATLVVNEGQTQVRGSEQAYQEAILGAAYGITRERAAQKSMA